MYIYIQQIIVLMYTKIYTHSYNFNKLKRFRDIFQKSLLWSVHKRIDLKYPQKECKRNKNVNLLEMQDVFIYKNRKVSLKTERLGDI